ncbi:hypothetical protein Tco_0043075, partial [Tanacetum coccineum]
SEIKESKAYKTYLGYATGAVPPKTARKFKKASPSKKDRDLVPVDEEPVKKGKRVKRPAKKSTTTPAVGIIMREAPVETKTKKKEKVDVTRGKGIETHLSGSGTVAEKPPRVEKITRTVTSEGTCDKPGVPDVTKDDSTKSESESWGNDEDDNNNEQESSNEGSKQENESDENETQSNSVKGSESENESEEHDSDSEQEEEVKDDDKEEDEFVHTPSHTDDKDDDDNLESKSDDVNEGDEEKGIDDTTYQFNNDMDSRLNEPTQTDKEVVQDEGVDAEMNDAQQGNENLVITQEQVIDDAHVT